MGDRDALRGWTALSTGAVALTVALAVSGCLPAVESSSPPGSEGQPPTATSGSEGDPAASDAPAPGASPAQSPPAPTGWPGIPRSGQLPAPRTTGPAPASARGPAQVPPPAGGPLLEIPAVAPPPSPAPQPEAAPCTTPPFVPAPAPEYGVGIPAVPLDVVPEWDIQAPAGLDAQTAVEWWSATGAPGAAGKAK